MTEAQEIKRIGAKAQKNSGRGRFAKGDAILGGKILIDFKEYSKSFSITQSIWAKICTDAFVSGRYVPALKLIIGDENKVRLYVIGESLFEEMYECWIKEYGD